VFAVHAFSVLWMIGMTFASRPSHIVCIGNTLMMWLVILGTPVVFGWWGWLSVAWAGRALHVYPALAVAIIAFAPSVWAYIMWGPRTFPGFLISSISSWYYFFTYPLVCVVVYFVLRAIRAKRQRSTRRASKQGATSQY
jgi:hypothetical protein